MGVLLFFHLIHEVIPLSTANTTSCLARPSKKWKNCCVSNRANDSILVGTPTGTESAEGKDKLQLLTVLAEQN